MERKKCPFRTVAAKTFASTQIYVVDLLYMVPHFPRKFLSQESLIDQVLMYTFLSSGFYVVEAPLVKVTRLTEIVRCSKVRKKCCI